MKKIDNTMLLMLLAGGCGNVMIGTTACTRKLTKIVAGSAGATLTDVKIGGVSVKTERNYPNALLAGDSLVAGAGECFDYVKLSAGTAEGFLAKEDPLLSGLSVAVVDGHSGGANTVTFGYTNTGGAGTRLVEFEYYNGAGQMVKSGCKEVYLAFGATLSCAIADAYPEVEVEDAAFTVVAMVNDGLAHGSSSTIESSEFTISPIAVTLTSVAVTDATSGAALAITLTHTTEGAGVVELQHKIVGTDLTVLAAGTVEVELTEGTGETASISGLVCPAVELLDEGVVFSVSLDGETWVDSAAFSITPAE